MKKRILTLVIAILTLSLLVCASVVAASASEETPTVSIDRFNLTFESDTYIKYAVKFSGVDDESITRGNTGMLYWTEPQTTYTIGSESSSSEIIGYTTIEGEKYYTFSYDKFAAKEMTDYIYSVAYVIADGEYYYSAPVKYSILTYAYDKLGYIGTATESEALKDMLVNLLEYGAAAQKHFGYRTDHLADEQYYQVTVEGGTLEDGFTTGLYLEGESVTVTAPELSKNSVPFVAWVDAHGTEISTKYESDITAVAENSTYTATYADDGVVYTRQFDNTYAVTDYIGTAANVVIASTYDGKPVTKISDRAFYGCSSLIGIDIPDSITKIGRYSFCDCSNITSIVISDGLTSIDYGTFDGCSNLKDVYYNGTVEDWCNISFNHADSNPMYNGAKLYFEGELVTELVIPDSVTKIKEYAFYNCTSLVSIEIPGSVTSIGSSAFCNYDSLKDVYYTGSARDWCNISFENMFSNPMYYCDNLYFGGELVTEIVIPDTITEIKDYAFYDCDSLVSIELPDSVTSIGWHAFYDCESLVSVNIPDSVTSIYGSAFYNCDSLTSIAIPDGVTSIGSSAFQYCTSLTSIEIPDSVTSIGSYAFYACTKLGSIELPNSVTSIGICAFSACDSITSVVIPDSVTSMGDSAFSDCDSLTSVVVGDGVTSIGDYAFFACDNLTSVVISNSVTSIGSDAFRWCHKLTSIEIPDSVTSIGYQAFCGCNNLTSIVIPDSVTSIGDQAFRDCDGLTIYCEAESQPDNWASDWNYSNRPVVWGYKG